MDGRAILRNAAKCLECGVVVESKHRHDWVKCDCGNLFVDGGKVYIRRGAADPSKVQDLSLFSEVEQDEKVNTPAGDQWTTTETMGQI